MTRLLTYSCLLCIGMVLGWWLRGATPSAEPLQPQPSPSSYSMRVVTPATMPSDGNLATQPNAPPVSNVTGSPKAAHFEQLLYKQDFEQAIAYYESALKIDNRYQTLLKPSLEAYLSASLQLCTGAAFIELVDLWLDAYYDDISVLLLLAENQRLCSSPEEAARTLQIARTYAMEPGLQISVTDAVARLVNSTDKTLSQQKSWIALLGFFEFLQAIDLATKDSELRRATLYQLLGENQRSQEVLLALREQDDGLDSQWTTALQLQWGKSTSQSADKELPTQAIPLTRRGDHFLVSTLIDDGSSVTLMLDTGASVTILSRDSFEQIESSGFQYRGSRLFNTPNGVTQGEVYQTTSITLGNSRLSNVDIAVLDYESASGSDGLLGMNVLRNYQFEIDQDRNVLYLHPR